MLLVLKSSLIILLHSTLPQAQRQFCVSEGHGNSCAPLVGVSSDDNDDVIELLLMNYDAV